MKSVLHIYVFFSLFLAINVQAQYAVPPVPPGTVAPVYPVHPVPVHPIYPVHPVPAFGSVCTAVNSCWNGAFSYTISCRAQSGPAAACTWRTGYGFVSCTGYIPGPYGWFWGTDTRFCY